MKELSFKSFVEAKGLNEEIKQVSTIPEIVFEIFSFSLQTHIYHLQTKLSNDHIVIGEFYDEIRKEADELAEQYIGKVNSFAWTDKVQKEFNISYNKEEFLVQIDEFCNLISKGLEQVQGTEFESMREELVEIQGAINTLKYKLKMK